MRKTIAHIGPGAFFRAFLGPYTQDAIEAGGDWAITAISLRTPHIARALAAQNQRYTAVTRAPSGDTLRTITAIQDSLVAPQNPEAAIAALAAPSTKIITLTITEKGYCLDPATGTLNAAHPDIAQDLAHPQSPKSAPGLLIAALARRKAHGSPVTILSLDNLPANGRTTKATLLALARLNDPELAGWIDQHIPIPSTMVDRITPATTEADHATLTPSDPAAVFHEPFRQWVIEAFDGPRPAWPAQFVRSVSAHELMKLRCLNGTHSMLAYLGYLARFETIAEATNDPTLQTLIENTWAEEILPTLPQPEGEDLPAYTRSLMSRYQNPAIRHRLWQIAMDGSQKLPQRLLGTIEDSLIAGRIPKRLCLAVAAWMRYVSGTDEQGNPIDIRDPLAARLKSLSDQAKTPQDTAAAFLSLTSIFPTPLAQNQTFRQEVTTALTHLTQHGAHKTAALYA